jgi:hypothetical protein
MALTFWLLVFGEGVWQMLKLRKKRELVKIKKKIYIHILIG